MEKNASEKGVGIDGYLFRLIATFEAAAMQQLGKIAHPLTGDVEVNLEGASDSIEMLVAIQRKTEGNLNTDEKRLLEHVLYQLRMNYVDVAEEAKSEPAGDGQGDDQEAAGDKGEGGGDEASPDTADAHDAAGDDDTQTSDSEENSQ